MSWLSQLLQKNSPDPRVRLELADQILNHLGRSRIPSDSRTVNEFCDVIFVWLSASNFKVSLQSLEILNTALDNSGDVLAPYLLERMTPFIERLGDAKAPVREAVSGLLMDLAEAPHCSYQLILDKISPGFNHKQWLVRVGTMNVFRMLLDEGREALEAQTNRLLPTFCKLLSDPNSEVREAATSTIVHVMVVFGPKIGESIRQKRLIPDQKMEVLTHRYDTALRNGSVPSSVPRPVRTVRQFASRPPSTSSSRGDLSELRRQSNSPMSSRPPTVSTMRRPSATPSRPGTAGAVSEEELRKAFTTVPKCDIFSVKELQTQLESIRVILEDDRNDWNKRTNALKLLRSIVINGGMDFETELIAGIHLLEAALVTSLKDLRSQVCKETSCTICFLAEKLGKSLYRTFLAVLPHALTLIQNSAKVMATSGAQACDFIVKNVEHPKLIPLVLMYGSHKSKDMRRQTVELVCQILSVWSPANVTKHLSVLSDAIKSGISDADSGVRQAARNAYSQLDMHFPAQAQQLFKTLDASKQKALGGQSSAASSTQSINSMRDSVLMGRRPGQPTFAKPNGFLTGRSSSAIDTKSIQRANSAVRAAPRTPARPNVVRSGNMGPPASGTMRPPMGTRPLFRQKSDLTASPASQSSRPSSRTTSPKASVTRRVPRTPVATHVSAPTRTPARDTTNTAAHGSGYGSVSSRTNGKSNGVAAEEIFSAINNLAISNAEDDDFLLGEQYYGTQRDAVLLKALEGCSSSNLTEKRDGLKTIIDLLRSGYDLRKEVADKMVLVFNKLLAESNHRLVTSLLDTICELIQRHHHLLSNWLPQLMHKIITKHSQELLPTVKDPLQHCLTAIRHGFPKDQLFQAVCKIIIDSPIQVPTPKVKHGILVFMHELVREMEAGVEFNTPEVRSAVHKIFEWLEDAKNQHFKLAAEQVVCDLFNLNTAEFSLLLTTFPPAWKEYTYALLNNRPSEPMAQQSMHTESSMVQRALNASFASESARNSPARNGHGTTVGSGIGSPARKTLNGSGTTVAAASPAGSTATAVDLSYKSMDSFKDLDGSLDQTIHLASDASAQKQYVDGLLTEIAGVVDNPQRASEQNKALLQLYQMVSEGSLTTWDEYFDFILVRVLGCLESEDVGVKKNAIRLLSKACVVQAVRFYNSADLVILKLFAAVLKNQENTMLCTVAEDCMKVLASHLPAHLVMRSLHPLIESNEDPRIGCALKMLEKLVDNMDVEDLRPFIDQIAPNVVQAYSHPMSAIRKCAVFCLVAMVHKMGREPMEQHLMPLDVKGNKVVEIYLQRRQTASTHF